MWVCRPRKTGCRSFALYSFHAPTNIMCTQPVGGLPAASIRRRSRRCRSSGGKRSGAGCGDHITIRWWRRRTNDTPPFHLRWKRDDSRTPGYARVGTALRLTCKGGVWAIRRTSRPPIPACSRWRLDRRRPREYLISAQSTQGLSGWDHGIGPATQTSVTQPAPGPRPSPSRRKETDVQQWTTRARCV
jgi:hypothetical protein